MSDKSPTGISIQQTKLLDRTVTADFKKILKAQSKAAILFSVGKYDGTLSSLAGAGVVDGFKLANDPEHLVYSSSFS